MAATYNFTIEQGATLVKRFVWRDKNNQPINLTGCTAKMQVKEAANFARAQQLKAELASATTVEQVEGIMW